MPQKPYRSCPGKGPRYRICPNLIRGSETCCPECKPYEKARVRRYDQERDQSLGRKFLHSTAWRKIRGVKLARDPLCQMCEADGLTVEAVLVHHVNENQLDSRDENLLSLCSYHHEIIHKARRFGKK